MNVKIIKPGNVKIQRVNILKIFFTEICFTKGWITTMHIILQNNEQEYKRQI